MFMVVFSGVLGWSQLARGGDEIDPTWHGKCVNWVNTMRAREGLPALQRWTDFEPCGDQAARRDAKRNGGTIGWSISQGIFCDWAPYKPTFQVTCRHEAATEDSLEKCVTDMWQEKENLFVNSNGALECKDGRALEDCADGYIHMRGGHLGHNMYDRVTCGIHQLENGRMWLSVIYGRGEKVVPKMLKKAENWPYAPVDWDRKKFQQYGYACGGNKDTVPAEMLPKDCAEGLNFQQYDACEGEYQRDYFVEAGCTIPTSMPTVAPTAAPTKAPTSAPTSAPTPAPTSAPTSEPGSVCDGIDNLKECKKTEGCIFGKKGPCKLMTSSCSSIRNKKTCKTANPCYWEKNSCVPRATPEPTEPETPEPTEPALPSCKTATNYESCKATDGCIWGKKGPCEELAGSCDSLDERRMCNSASGCEWVDSVCSETAIASD